jgi:peptide deformylase
MAANMIGFRKKIIVVLVDGEYTIMVNPEIVEKSKQIYETMESCLSLIGSRRATRHKNITVEYLDKKFKPKKRRFNDFEAQVIQHEIDHFDGILI